MKLTQDRLKELLDYDPETGVFTWKIRVNNKKIRTVAGSIDKEGYCIICLDGKKHRSHRLAFLYMEGYLPENCVDHIDRNKNNNKWDNLREVSHTCNMRNRDIQKNNKSGIIGISWNKRDNNWLASIRISNKSFYLGYYINLIDAVKARWQAEKKYNFPTCNTTSSAYLFLKNHGAI